MPRITMEAARVNAGFTQEALAEKLGVSRSTVNLIENGKIEVKPYYLFAFCHVVGMTEDDIFLPDKATESGRKEE